MLSLNSTQVTDEGLKHLTGLASLKWLWLNNTQVTDAGLAHLKELTSLRRIYLAETQVTDEGVAELRRALPNLSFWAPDTQPSNDSPVVSDTGKEVTIIRPGMSLLPSLKALRRQGLRIRECCDRAISGREFEIDRPHGSADVLILDATSDHEHGGYVIKNIYWWINYEDDVNRPKGLRKNLHRSVLHLDVKNLPSPPTAKKAG
jgi:hypothetical protein